MAQLQLGARATSGCADSAAAPRAYVVPPRFVGVGAAVGVVLRHPTPPPHPCAFFSSSQPPSPHCSTTTASRTPVRNAATSVQRARSRTTQRRL